MVALENWLAEAPPLMQHGLSAALAVIGVALWLLGRSLARPLGAVTGLVASAGAALLFARERFGPLAIILGAAVGCAVAWLLFRLWMGALTATLGAALVAGGFVFWAGDAAGPPATVTSPTAPDDAASDEAASAKAVMEAVLADMRARWDHLEGGQRWTAVVTTGAAALVGLLGGLAAPYWSASIVCAALGSLMAVASILIWGRLAGWAWPAALATPLHTIAALGLITAVGVALQWIIFRPRSD